MYKSGAEPLVTKTQRTMNQPDTITNMHVWWV